MAYTFGINMIWTIGQGRLQLQGVAYIVSKCHGLWSTNAIFTHPMYILLSTSLPHFVDGDQQTELNQTLQNGGR